MSAFDYHAYLASREWALKREAVRVRCGNVCERCHRAPHQQTHHLTYARVGHELLEDLLGVCADCHRFLSGKTNVDPILQKRFIILSNNRIDESHFRIARLLRVAQRLSISLNTGWWPTQLHDHKGDLTVYATRPPCLSDDEAVALAWEEENEYNYDYIVNGRLFIEGSYERAAWSWEKEIEGIGEEVWL